MKHEDKGGRVSSGSVALDLATFEKITRGTFVLVWFLLLLMVWVKLWVHISCFETVSVHSRCASLSGKTTTTRRPTALRTRDNLLARGSFSRTDGEQPTEPKRFSESFLLAAEGTLRNKSLEAHHNTITE